MGNDEYEILPHKEILNIKKELNDLRGGSSTKQLATSMEELKKTMAGLIDLFKAATQEMKTQEKEEVTISKKIDKVIKQNKIIAEGIVSVADMVEELRSGGGFNTHASPELSSLGVEPPKQEPEDFHPEPTPEPFHPEPKPEPFRSERRQESKPFPPPGQPPRSQDPSMKQESLFQPSHAPGHQQAHPAPPSPSPGQEQQFEPPEFNAPDFGHPASAPNEPPPLDFGAPPGSAPRPPFPPQGEQQFPPPPGGEFPQPPEPPKEEEPKKKGLFGSLFKK